MCWSLSCFIHLPSFHKDHTYTSHEQNLPVGAWQWRFSTTKQASLVMGFLNQMEYNSFSERMSFSLDWHLMKELVFSVITQMYSNPTSSSFLGAMSKAYFA